MSRVTSADLKQQYPQTLKLSAIISLTSVIALFLLSKQFAGVVPTKLPEIAPLEISEIPLTRMQKKIIVPPKPSQLVIDMTANLEDVVDIPVFEDIGGHIFQVPPPPPPPAIPIDFVLVEIPPQLIGGSSAITSYISEKSLYPETAAEIGVSGTTIIQFIVDVDGIPKDVHVLQERPEDLGFGAAGVRVMKAMRFTPGQQRDKLVPVSMKQTINFKIGR